MNLHSKSSNYEKNDIMITEVSKNNSNMSYNEYYNLGSIFEKFI